VSTRIGRRWLALLLGCAALTACASQSAATQSAGPGLTAVTPGRPQLLMTGPGSGLLVWSSGSASVLLASSNGFRTLTNATPPAVPTDGGLVLARQGGRLLVGIMPTGALTSSPFLVGDGTRTGWTAGELPGALARWPEAVALQGSTIWALLGGGASSRLVESADAGLSWQVLAQAKALDPTGRLVLTGVRWTDPAHGWLSGVGPAGRPLLFTTNTGGRAWHSVPLAPVPGATSKAEESSSTPCGTGTSLVSLVVTHPSAGGPGQTLVERTSDGGARWDAGAVVAVPTGEPVWACGSGLLWLAVPGRSSGRLLVSTNAGLTWQDSGTPPGQVSALAITGAGSGYAVTGQGSSALLWSVSDAGSRFAPIPLPGWVAKLSAGGES
jgi:hypothetical protein